MRPILKRLLAITVWGIICYAVFNTTFPSMLVGSAFGGQLLLFLLLFGVPSVLLWFAFGRKPKIEESNRDATSFEQEKAQAKESPSYRKPASAPAASPQTAPIPALQVGLANVTIHKTQRGKAKVSLEGLVILEETTTGIEIEEDAAK